MRQKFVEDGSRIEGCRLTEIKSKITIKNPAGMFSAMAAGHCPEARI